MNRLRSLLAAGALAGFAAASSAASYTGVYIFGDSLSDSGNIAASFGRDPSQVITGNSYIPNLPYASGQFTNGDVWARSFTNSLGLGSFGQPSRLGGGNYAFGGARMTTDTPGVPPVAAQTSLFLESSGGGLAPASALYVLEGGGNDARDTLVAAAGSSTPGAVIAAAAAAHAQTVGQIVDQLQGAGARDIIVWNVPNLGLGPAINSQGPGAAFLGTQISAAMNTALAARLSGEAGVSIFDVYGLQNMWTANPGAYGLSNVTDACGAAAAGCDPSTSLFWDGIHPTAAGHALLAQGMIAAVPEPATWAMLAAGLLMLLGARAHRRRSPKSAASAQA